MARSRTIWRGGKIFAEYEGDKLVYLDPEYDAPKRSETVSAPYFIKDIGEYKSPIDGQMITTRSMHRDHLRAHDVVEVGNDRMAAPTETAHSDRGLGEAIKRRVEEVKALPQAEYDSHVQKQAHEHAEIASLATATP